MTEPDNRSFNGIILPVAIIAMPFMPNGYTIEILPPDAIHQAAPALAAITLDCVAGGDSIGFMQGLDRAEAERFWETVARTAKADKRIVLIARRDRDRAIVGTAQVIPSAFSNQSHRADVAKMQVLRSERKQGLGTALLAAAEAAACRAGRMLLVLDTASADAGRLYSAQGWTKVGRIPDYALMPDGTPCGTDIYFKKLDGNATS